MSEKVTRRWARWVVDHWIWIDYEQVDNTQEPIVLLPAADYDALVERAESLRQEVVRLESQRRLISDKNDELQARVEQLESNIESYKAIQATTESYLQTANQRVQELEKQRDEYFRLNEEAFNASLEHLTPEGRVMMRERLTQISNVLMGRKL